MNEEWKPINGAKFSDGDSLELRYSPREDVAFESEASYFNGRFYLAGNQVIYIIIDALRNDRKNVFYRSKQHEQDLPE